MKKSLFCLCIFLFCMLIFACQKQTMPPAAPQEQSTQTFVQTAEPLEQKSAENAQEESAEPATLQSSSEPEIIPVNDTDRFDGSIIDSTLLPDGTIIEERLHRQDVIISLIADTNVYGFPVEPEPLSAEETPEADAEAAVETESIPTTAQTGIIGSIGRGQRVSVLSIVKKSFSLTTANSDDFWLKIVFLTQDAECGYLHLGALKDPYDNDQWIVLEKMRIGNELWAIQKCDSSVLLENDTPAYTFPNAPLPLEKALSSLETGLYVTVNAVATLIFETEPYNGYSTDRWVRIIFNGEEMWIKETYIVSTTSLSTPYTMLQNQLQ